MGVTIHYEGTLRDDASLEALLRRVEAFARASGWPTERIESKSTRLTRVIDEEDVDYEGPVHGVVVFPHEDCDPLALEFGSDLFAQDFVKTQFAGAHIHRQVVELLREIEPAFSSFTVEDEGEFWNTLDPGTLEQHIERTNQVLADYLAEHPGAQAKVKLPSGRIVDVMS